MDRTSRARGGQHTPPLVGLGHVRRAYGYTLDDVCDGIEAITGTRPKPGTVSAIELGHRKPSDALLEALLTFFELDGQAHVYPRPRLVPTPVRREAKDVA